MYKNILACFDGSPMDTQILEASTYLAKNLNAKLQGLTVQDTLTLEGPLMYDLSGALAFIPQMNFLEETRKLLREKAKNILTGFERKCQEEGVNYEAVTEEGIIHRVILEKSELNDLTIVGRRGLNYQFEKEFLGSVTDRVIRSCRRPILVVTHEFQAFKNPMLAYDGSHNAKKALATAAQLCSELKLPLTVLYVGADAKEANEILNEAKTYLETYTVTTKFAHQEGNPHEIVAQYAKKHKHDLVILGSRGRNSLIEWIVGSTTQYALWSGAFHVLVDR